MDNSPDHSDDRAAEPTRYVDPMPVDGTRLVEQPPSSAATRSRSLLIGVITALSIGVVAVGVALAADIAGPSDSGDPAPAAVVETGTSTAGSVQQAVASTESSSAPAASEVAAAPVTTLTTAAQQAAGQEVVPPQVQQDPYTPPVGHVDSCAYPNMAPTVVSRTTYTPAPTPTVTVVTAPETCPPYSAGYPWDGS
ncbi:hypothetical protein AB0425_17385 [Actinosynnema sp. NPDC051121]